MPAPRTVFLSLVKIFNAGNLELVTYHQEPIQILTPQPGWVEQDPNEILDKTMLCIEKAVDKFEGLGHDRSAIKGNCFRCASVRRHRSPAVIGVTNQRETTVLWDKHTGKVLHNALVWLDARTQETVDFLLKQFNKHRDCLQVRSVRGTVRLEVRLSPRSNAVCRSPRISRR